MLTIHRHHQDAHHYQALPLIATSYRCGMVLEVRGYGFEKVVCAYHNNYIYIVDYDISVSEVTNMFAITRKVMAHVE